MRSNPAIQAAETLLPVLCRAVVVSPAKLQVEVRHGSASSSVSASPDPVEAGNLIGKGGRTVKAFCTLAKAIGEQHQWPILYAVETEAGENPPRKDRGDVPEKEWSAVYVGGLLDSVLSSYLRFKPEVKVLTDTRHRTAWEVVLDDSEPVGQVDDATIAAALDTIFQAVGKLYGRTVSIAYVRRRQPATADGRFSKETPA